MTDTTNENENEPNPEDQESGEGTEEAKPEGDEAPKADEAAKPEENEDQVLDLDGAKKVIDKVRKEAAGSRVKLREVEAKLADAKTPEQVEALLTELKAANAAEAHALVVENVALKFKLPEDLAAALKGDSREELEKHAAVLAKYAPNTGAGGDPDLRGGLDPTGDSDAAFDPVALVTSVRKNRY